MDHKNTNRPASDAEWYCRRDPEEERFYALFFRMCRKYDVRWASATPKEQAFIEEVTRVTYERDRVQRLGTPLHSARSSTVWSRFRTAAGSSGESSFTGEGNIHREWIPFL